MENAEKCGIFILWFSGIMHSAFAHFSYAERIEVTHTSEYNI